MRISLKRILRYQNQREQRELLQEQDRARGAGDGGEAWDVASVAMEESSYSGEGEESQSRADRLRSGRQGTLGGQRAVQRLVVCRHADRFLPDWSHDIEALLAGEGGGGQGGDARLANDIPLSPLGLRQARELASCLASSRDVAIIISSPYLRCLQTAHAVSLATGARIAVEPGLAEVSQSLGLGFMNLHCSLLLHVLLVLKFGDLFLLEAFSGSGQKRLG